MTKSPEKNNAFAIWQHLVELRRRLIYSLIIFMVAFVISYMFSENILGYLTKPLTSLFDQKIGRRFIYTSLTEAFVAYIKASLFAACILSIPFVSFQLWRFISPALYSNEKRIYRGAFFMIPVLFIAGSAMAYYVVCPVAWKFFLSFESSKILSVPLQFEAKISEYLGVTLKMMMVFGFGFQLPIILIGLVAFGLLSVKDLQKGRKYAFLVITIIAAVLTPPDLISPIGLIMPVYALYEGALLWLSFLYPKQNADE